MLNNNCYSDVIYEVASLVEELFLYQVKYQVDLQCRYRIIIILYSLSQTNLKFVCTTAMIIIEV